MQLTAAEARTFNCEEGEDSCLDKKWESLDKDNRVLSGRGRRNWGEEKREKGGRVRIIL